MVRNGKKVRWQGHSVLTSFRLVRAVWSLPPNAGGGPPLMKRPCADAVAPRQGWGEGAVGPSYPALHPNPNPPPSQGEGAQRQARMPQTE